MPLVLQPVVETDMERLMEIQNRAFSTDPWNQVMFPNGVTAASKITMVEMVRKDFHDPHTVFVKVVDTDRENEIVSFARWYIYKQERPESEWNKPAEWRDWGPDTNNKALNDFIGALAEARRKHMAGKPHCLLGLLDTHPDHQKRGAGGMLVQWGINVADEAGLCCYLEASSAGYTLYRQKGFKDVETIEMDMAKYGKEGVSRHVCMIRPAKVE
ncbi:hypothetical protein MMC11_004879 [Xylographa trunciseda]|nr:hypothetical protein [Xylographa trunciseda]